MSFILVDLGEEYIMKNGFDGASISNGLYDDSTDLIADTDDLAAITTEPAGAAYARQAVTASASDISGDWGITYSISFDTSDSTVSVDGVFAVINFLASDTGDASATDHLVYTAGLSQARNLSDIDTLNVDVTVTVT